MHAGIERAHAVIACVDSDAENIFIALTARELIEQGSGHRPGGDRGDRAQADSRRRRRGDLPIHDGRHRDGPARPEPRGPHMSDPVAELRTALGAAATALRGSSGETDLGSGLKLERPKRAGQGDYATNAAMLLAPVLGAPPRDIAAQLGGQLGRRLAPALSRYEVAGPGFLNLVLSDDWHRARCFSCSMQGTHSGRAAPRRPERILLEFVSANPTGPIVAASGRHAAYGDSLGTDSRVRGPHRLPRVLRQRLRLADPAAR